MEPLSKKLTEENIAFSYPIQIVDIDGNETYYENYGGFWRRREYDSEGRGRETYYEDADSVWHKKEYDSQGNETYYENGDGHWRKREYDSEGRETYYENIDGFWRKREYDPQGNETYYENSGGDKSGTPKARHEGKVVTVDGTDYELKEINQ